MKSTKGSPSRSKNTSPGAAACVGRVLSGRAPQPFKEKAPPSCGVFRSRDGRAQSNLGGLKKTRFCHRAIFPLPCRCGYRPSGFAGRDVAALDTLPGWPVPHADPNIPHFPRVFEAAVVCFGPPDLNRPWPSFWSIHAVRTISPSGVTPPQNPRAGLGFNTSESPAFAPGFLMRCGVVYMPSNEPWAAAAAPD